MIPFIGRYIATNLCIYIGGKRIVSPTLKKDVYSTKFFVSLFR